MKSPPASLRLALTISLLAVMALVLSCGQRDPTYRIAPPIVVLQGEIAVTSSVPGAAISLDNVATGRTTPDTLRNVSAGDHAVSVYLPGYFAATDTVQVVAGALRNLDFVLQTIPTTGAIAIAAPYPADILLDGISTGRAAPATLEGIEPGAHTVALSLGGFKPQPSSSAVSVVAGETAAIAFDLVAPKKVLAEDFSNYACTPCPPADEALQTVVASEEPGRVVPMNPHLNFPSQADPFYRFNPPANCARSKYYYDGGVSLMPTIMVDGLAVDQAPWEPAIRARVQERSSSPTAPLAIGVQGKLEGGDYRVTVDLWGVSAALPTLKLFACVVERSVVLNPAGPNGQSHFVNVLRQVLPAPEGTCSSLTSFGGWDTSLGLAEHKTFQASWTIQGNAPPAPNPAQLGVIAIAFDATTKLVLQVGTSFDP
jgi:hypothetical protein